MNNKEILEFIYKKRDSEPKLGLERIRILLDYLGNPQKDLKFIHIAGTNGKGSTTTMIANILKNAGYNVGKFISPYIIDFTERIQVNDNYISNEDVSRILKSMEKIINEMEKENNAPSSFEIITAIAFVYYKEKNCDIVCLEVGMGGRFDATNIIENTLVSVITLIDFDHMNYLGNKIEEIAFEKCGIIKENSNVVSYIKQRDEALKVIKEVCKNKNSNLIIPSVNDLKLETKDNLKYFFIYENKGYNLSLCGKYQVYNAISAIETIKILNKLSYNIKDEIVEKGINTAVFPARLEIVSKNPLVIIDGSHNVSGAKTIKEFIENSKYKNSVGIIGMIEGKQHKEFLEIVAPLFNKLIIVPVKKEYNLGKNNQDNLLDIAKKYNKNSVYIEDYAKAFNKAKNVENVDNIIVTGSLYLASDFRKMLIK